VPAWLLPIVIKFVVPEVLSLLVKSGLINSVEADIAKGAINLEQGLKSIKTYREYPDSLPAMATPNNLASQKVQ
jgi:hypothetical protein